MNDQEKNRALLPSGFADLLPPEAGIEADAVSVLMGCFRSFGYERVKPPLLEFEDSLFAPGPGATLVDNSFRLMDTVSHKMMGLRPDITVQISRIASSRLKAEERPLRLTYAGDVLRTKASQQRTARQFCQVGCELIGDQSEECDIEACVMALVALDNLGIEGLSLDLACPRLVSEVLSAHNIDESSPEAAMVYEALARRDLEALAHLDGALLDVLRGLVQASGAADTALEKLQALNLQGESVQKLARIYEGVRKALGDMGLFERVALTLDPVERKGFEYKSGIAFTLFSRAVSGELGRGGRYSLQDNVESGVGFTLYMDTVCAAMVGPQLREIVYVPNDEGWDVIARLQKEGWVVMRGGDVPARATHIYKNGQVKER